MRILLLSPLPPPVGGIATWTKNILEFFKGNPDGYEIVHQDTASRTRDITNNGNLYRLFHGIIDSIRIINKLTRNISRFNPDLIHLTSSASMALIKDYYILRTAVRKKIPVIVHWRFGRIPELAERLNWEWKLLCRITERSNYAIVIDNNSFKCLSDAGIKNVVMIPNPMGNDTEAQHNFTAESSERESGVVLYVGHLIKSKGLFELVEACTTLAQVRKLELVGPGENKIKRDLSEVATVRGNAGWLKISETRRSEQIYTTMCSASILVLPSHTEGFPNVVLEAMSAGCPVIATSVGALPEILAVSSDKPCGICVPAKDILKLRDAIAMLLSDQNMAKTMGMNGRERVLEKYSMRIVTDQYKFLWDKTLAR